ncbi:MAG: methyl-accepting chemotaxis protein [Oscillospiraceae bacterium]|nr:methyl-accepting chemotaxis protein [Oscillospiraceae bacterium]
MKNMKLRTKLLVGFALMAVIGLVLGATGIISMLTVSKMTRELQSLTEVTYEITDVLNAHYNWKQGLTMSVFTGSEFTGSLDPGACALGKWMNSESSKRIKDTQFLELLNKALDPHAYMHNEAETVLNSLNAGDNEGAQNKLSTEIIPRAEETISFLDQMASRLKEMVGENESSIVALEQSLIILLIAFIIAAFVASVLLALLLTKSITKPLHALASFMEKAGREGDITLTPEDVEIIGKLSAVKDEIGLTISASAGFVKHVTVISEALGLIANRDLRVENTILSKRDVLGLSLEQMTENLNKAFGEIQSSTGQVSIGSKQVANGAQSLAQGSTQQAAAVEQLSSSIATIAEKTKTNAYMAEKASNLANTIKTNAEKGNHQMGEMTRAVQEINEASQSISKVIKTIDDIAFQTNILALNAAVEAARAGQHGKGFAVVAEEVRNLASKSAEAAKDTGVMIQNSIDKAELGNHIAAETASSLAEIVSGINESNQLIGEIAKSSEDQSTGIAQINTGIDQVAQVIQQNSATAEESAASSEEMSSQANILEDTIAQFKLKSGGTSL